MIIDSSCQEFELDMSSFSAPEDWGLNWKTQRQGVNLSKGACICVREKERDREIETERQRQRDNSRQLPCKYKTWTQSYISFLPHSYIAKSQRTAQDQERRKYIPLHDWECQVPGKTCRSKNIAVVFLGKQNYHILLQNQSKEDNYNGNVCARPCMCDDVCEWLCEMISHYINNSNIK